MITQGHAQPEELSLAAVQNPGVWTTDNRGLLVKGAGSIFPLITIGGRVFSADPFGEYTVDGQTLSYGGLIAYQGTRVYLDPGGSKPLIGSQIVILDSPITGTVSPTVTAAPRGDLLVDGQLLTAGGVITISTTRISFAKDGSFVVVGSSTRWFGAEPTSSLDPGLASMIIKAFIGDGDATSLNTKTSLPDLLAKETAGPRASTQTLTGDQVVPMTSGASQTSTLWASFWRKCWSLMLIFLYEII